MSKPVVISSRFQPEDGPKTYAFSLTRAERKVFRKRRRIPVSQWVETHRVLTMSSLPGRWHNDVTPYLAGVMDAAFYPGVQTTIICKAPQVGGSEAVNNCVAYAIDRDPGPVLYVYPDEQTARDNSRDRILPMIQASPRLRSFMTGIMDDSAAMRINLQHMPIYLGWARSASRLANKPIKIVVFDETDKYPESANKREADPISLGEKRTVTYRWDRRIFKLSTPTVEGGAIWVALNVEAQVVFHFHVRCPQCGVRQLMIFDRIKWPEDERDPEALESSGLTRYECKGCGAMWDDGERNRAVRLGHWRDAVSGLELHDYLNQRHPRKVGFHIPSWLSRFVSLSEVAAAFLRGQRNKHKLKDFMNNHKAEPWVDFQVQREEDRVLELCDDRPRGVVPGPDEEERPRVAGLVAGVDTQDRYLVYVIRAFGWGEAEESWLVRCGTVLDFAGLEDVLWKSVYMDGAGNEHRVRFALQDAMGHRTKEVYQFCSRHRGRIAPVQGKQRLSAPIQFSPIEYYPGTKVRVPGGLQLFKVDTTFFKNDLNHALQVQPGDPGAFHLHADTPRDYAKQMCVEWFDDQKFVWVQPEGKAQHYWDCEYLTRAAWYHLGGANLEQPGSSPRPDSPQPPPPLTRQDILKGFRPQWWQK